MIRILRRLSVFEMMLLWGLLVYVPVTLYAAISLHSVQVEYRKLMSDFSAYDPSRSTFTSFGRLLRELRFPGTTAIEDIRDIQQPHRTQFLNDAKTAYTYLLSLTLIFSAMLHIIISLSVHRSYRRLVRAMEEFANNKTLPMEDFFGPWDFLQVSNSLSKLQNRLTKEEQDRALFMRNISHDIKTPLTSIKEGASLISDLSSEQSSREIKEISEIMVRSGEKLHEAIDKLMQYSVQLSHSSVKLREHVDISDLARNAIKNHFISIRNKQLVIRENLETTQSFVDSDQISIVIDNLLSNAIKHSPAQGNIEISVERRHPRGTRIVIQDEGPGISSDKKSAIFAPYYIGHERADTSVQDTGLGLAIAKQFVDAHNGSLNLLESNIGAKFEVLLS